MLEKEIEENFPNGYEYLKKNEEFLRGREKGRFDNPKEWFLFSRKQGIDFVEIPKIITPEISFGGNMIFDEQGEFYHNTKCYSFVKNPETKEDYKFFLAILNSSLLWFFLQNTGYELRGGYFVYKTKYLEPFGIPELKNLEAQKPFIEKVDQILNAKKQNPKADTSEWEKEIDEMVFDLYGLNEEERGVVLKG